MLSSAGQVLARRTFYGSREANPVENDFDRMWRKLNRQDREKIAAEYVSFEKMDWKQLTMDQKKASRIY